MWRGVLKLFLVLESIRAPYSIRISIIGVIPSFAATCRGVQPSAFVALMLSYIA
jgi:hypothetical protein